MQYYTTITTKSGKERRTGPHEVEELEAGALDLFRPVVHRLEDEGDTLFIHGRDVESVMFSPAEEEPRPPRVFTREEACSLQPGTLVRTIGGARHCLGPLYRIHDGCAVYGVEGSGPTTLTVTAVWLDIGIYSPTTIAEVVG